MVFEISYSRPRHFAIHQGGESWSMKLPLHHPSRRGVMVNVATLAPLAHSSHAHFLSDRYESHPFWIKEWGPRDQVYPITIGFPTRTPTANKINSWLGQRCWRTTHKMRHQTCLFSKWRSSFNPIPHILSSSFLNHGISVD